MLASIPRDVARSIGKPEVESYPFHSFHRSSATVGATPTREGRPSSHKPRGKVSETLQKQSPNHVENLRTL